ncbi:Uncharacterised protein [Yersinia enterocolitica]|uniref:Uncharacterized protein n=2 Tax=Yersiniaceae TaxID=1903411 RepID=A0A0T7P7U6_YEREN|nr:hypothetical protein YE14902_36001 [Yersinia enterocolitica (type O:5,27) str. YE149/02]CFQ69995.1 Uncharacterised protein [Yersinia enterocolitica]CNB74116.1 Uncharacterised protein [Yersinia enterocolitica]CND79300.1 Uncharacterised protein [Yersinia enterocolitica]CNI61624.1 Uncharacterised protein [Yersinia enterocolitica]
MTLLIVCLLFRKSINTLIDKVIKVKAKDFEVEFSAKLATVRREFKNHYSDKTMHLQHDISEPFAQSCILANINPEAAVLVSWRELELTAITAAAIRQLPILGESLNRASGIAAMKSLAPVYLSDSDKDYYESIGDLVKLIRYGELVDTKSANEFIELASSLSEYITKQVINPT